MLRRLTIRDFVLVDRLELEFATGFGALTGETGAGKSIPVDALAFALGDRADTGLIRNGAERAEVSAEFDLAGLHDAEVWLREAVDCFGLERFFGVLPPPSLGARLVGRRILRAGSARDDHREATVS